MCKSVLVLLVCAGFAPVVGKRLVVHLWGTRQLQGNLLRRVPVGFGLPAFLWVLCWNEEQCLGSHSVLGGTGEVGGDPYKEIDLWWCMAQAHDEKWWPASGSQTWRKIPRRTSICKFFNIKFLPTTAKTPVSTRTSSVVSILTRDVVRANR